METPPIVPRAPVPPVPPRPTLPVPPTVSAFASTLDRAFGAAGARVGTSGAPTRASPATGPSTARRGGRGAATTAPLVTLGAMLRSTGTGVAPAPGDATRAGAPRPAATTSAERVAQPPAVSATPPPAPAATGRGVLAGRVVVTPVDGRETSPFGPRRHPIHGGVRDHHGLDIAAPTGTSVGAVTDGVVVAVGDRGGYGLVVEVDHGGGVTSRYAHLSAIDVTVGDRLAPGERLGAVGSTGASTGPHLHLEIRVDGTPVDPRDAGV